MNLIMEILDTPCYWFLFYKDQLLLKKENGSFAIPYSIEPPVAINHSLDVDYNGELCAQTAALNEPMKENDKYVHMGLRASWDFLPKEWYEKAGKAYQLVHWDLHSKFCPCCGAAMIQVGAIVKKCPSCGEHVYPRISPAMIVLIRRGDEILLVRARNFKGTFHGLVAGFLEVGENIEDCVRREVREETGLEIDHITYFGSQSWPYPSGLMIGFVADYVSGEIKLQDDELSKGAFFRKDNLPEIPKKLSLARRLIDWWLEQD